MYRAIVGLVEAFQEQFSEREYLKPFSKYSEETEKIGPVLDLAIFARSRSAVNIGRGQSPPTVQPKRREIDPQLYWGTNRKPCVGNTMVTPKVGQSSPKWTKVQLQKFSPPGHRRLNSMPKRLTRLSFHLVFLLHTPAPLLHTPAATPITPSVEELLSATPHCRFFYRGCQKIFLLQPKWPIFTANFRPVPDLPRE